MNQIKAISILLLSFLAAAFVGQHSGTLAGAAAGLATASALSYSAFVLPHFGATSTTGTFYQLPKESSPFTHVAVVKAADLTDPTNSSVQTIGFVLPAGCRIADIFYDLVAPFQDDSDAAFLLTTMSVADSVPVTYIAAKELNANGSYVSLAQLDRVGAVTLGVGSALAAITGGEAPTETEHNLVITQINLIRLDLIALAAAAGGSNGGKVYTAAGQLNLAFTPTSGKKLLDLDRGEVRVFLALHKRGHLG